MVLRARLPRMSLSLPARSRASSRTAASGLRRKLGSGRGSGVAAANTANATPPSPSHVALLVALRREGLTAVGLVDTLAGLEGYLNAGEMERLKEALGSGEGGLGLVEGLVGVLVGTDGVQVGELMVAGWERWVVAGRLIAQGPEGVVEVLVSVKGALEALVGVFKGGDGFGMFRGGREGLSIARTDMVAECLRACLTVNEGKALLAVLRGKGAEGVLEGLVKAAADGAGNAGVLVGRLVGGVWHSGMDRVVVRPGGKKGVVWVQRCMKVCADEAVRRLDARDGWAAAQVVQVMMDAAARAGAIEPMEEEADERLDRSYVAIMGIVCASGFNDALLVMNLFRNPEDCIRVLDKAIEVGERGVVYEVLNGVQDLLWKLSERRVSELPSVRQRAEKMDPKALLDAIFERKDLLERAVRGEHGEKERVAAVDVIAAMMRVGDGKTIEKMVEVGMVSWTAETMRGACLVATRMGAAVQIMIGRTECADKWLADGEWLRLLTEDLGVRVSFRAVVCATAAALDSCATAPEKDAEAFRSGRSDLVEATRAAEAEYDKGLFKDLIPAEEPSTFEDDVFAGVDETLGAVSEDYAKEVSIRRRVEEGLATRDDRLVIPTNASSVTLSRAVARSKKDKKVGSPSPSGE